MLNTALQKVSSIRSAESSAKKIEKEIRDLESEIKRLETELTSLSRSQEYEQAFISFQKMAEAEMKREEFHAKIKDLFSRLSRAFTKYSYGITKETEQRLKILSEEPWKMLYEGNISLYSSLLQEIRKSILNGQIQLKDSDKVLQYTDLILESLPDLHQRAHTIKTEIETFRDLNVQVLNRVKELEHQIMRQTEELARSRQELQQQKKLTKDKAEEVNTLLNQAGEMLAELTGRRYYLTDED